MFGQCVRFSIICSVIILFLRCRKFRTLISYLPLFYYFIVSIHFFLNLMILNFKQKSSK
ncbi:hypothetical protein Lalb_Chr13g0300451 [Lupinus albus]|uniref:Uncharacterized protein n=1 Tax=Lupinus albus TaxID=3870 RepID=A0A6A4PJQ9_LUPAL|nr:hypothetical protein Lalb_Chr13g0300451 [Lupinus albus]